MHYWMGVEGTIFAAADWPGTMREVVDEINANNLDLIDLLASSPAEIICMGDNFSGDVQPPGFSNSGRGTITPRPSAACTPPGSSSPSTSTAGCAERWA